MLIGIPPTRLNQIAKPGKTLIVIMAINDAPLFSLGDIALMISPDVLRWQ